jgi:hypothetical protein
VRELVRRAPANENCVRTRRAQPLMRPWLARKGVVRSSASVSIEAHSEMLSSCKVETRSSRTGPSDQAPNQNHIDVAPSCGLGIFSHSSAARLVSTSFRVAIVQPFLRTAQGAVLGAGFADRVSRREYRPARKRARMLPCPAQNLIDCLLEICLAGISVPLSMAGYFFGNGEVHPQPAPASQRNSGIQAGGLNASSVGASAAQQGTRTVGAGRFTGGSGS